MGSLHVSATVPLRSGGWLRWLARILGLTLAALFLLVGIGGALVEEPSWTGEGAVLAILGLWAVMSLLAAWRWETLGGLSGLLAGLALAAFAVGTAGSFRLMAAAVTGLPIILISVAFLAVGRKRAG